MEVLTQAIFKDAPDWVKSAAVDSTGDVYFYAVPKKELSFDSDECWWVYLGKEDNSRTYSPCGDYDVSDWQNSAIDRVGYKCPSCGYFHAPHQCRECECINCYSSIV